MSGLARGSHVAQVFNQYCPVKPVATGRKSHAAMDLRHKRGAHDLKTH